MRTRKMKTLEPIIKALVVGALEDGGRYLFLIRTDSSGLERLELPSCIVYSGRSPFAEIKAEFQRQTGIEGQVGEIIYEGSVNAGSNKKKNFVPVLVFKIIARERRANPSSEFSSFKWLDVEAAKQYKIARNTQWILKTRQTYEQK